MLKKDNTKVKKLYRGFASFLFIFLGFNPFFAQNLIPAYQNRANQIELTNINSLLQSFASFGIKKTGSTNNTNAFNWIKDQYTSYGFASNQISEQSFSYGSTTSKNLIVTKTGTLYPNTFVIICGHFDTVAGPGVNDNGSGTSIILEAARILKDVPTEYSIKFIHFSGEEQGLIGSQAYVDYIVNATNPKMDIRLVFNLDQVGGKLGNINNSVMCERDTSNKPSTNNATSAIKNQELMTYVSLYSGGLSPVLSYAYASDYMPFQGNNEIIVGLYENPRSHTEHTPNDTYSKVDPAYILKVGKAAIGALQHFAVASTSLETLEIELVEEDLFSLYPNPAKNYLHIELKSPLENYDFDILDASGKVLISTKNKTEINTSTLSSGAYFGRLKIEGKEVVKKFIISK